MDLNCDLKYIVYITINMINGKMYVGVHKTNPEVFDGYIGCGIYKQNDATKNRAFHKAVKKYGYNNFKRTTIQIFPNTEEGELQAYKLEEEIVTPTFLKSKSVYNECTGGKGDAVESQKKRVYMYSLDGNFLRSFKCSRDAAHFISPENEDNVRQAIKNNVAGRVSSAHGYYFSYKKEFGYTNAVLSPVAQYTLQGKFIRSFTSLHSAEEELNLNSIQQAIVKGYTCGGYQWKYFCGDTNDIAPLLSMYTKNKILPIDMYDMEGNFIKSYDCVYDCVKDNPKFIASQINRVLRGILKSHRNHKFKYKDKDIV